MISIQTETLLTLAQAARLRPGGQSGRPTHPSTVARWAFRGIRGQRLEVLRLGGRVYTSAEALQRFADGLTGARTESGHGAAVTVRSGEAANAELARLGF